MSKPIFIAPFTTVQLWPTGGNITEVTVPSNLLTPDGISLMVKAFTNVMLTRQAARVDVPAN